MAVRAGSGAAGRVAGVRLRQRAVVRRRAVGDVRMIPLPLHERQRVRLPELIQVAPSNVNPWRWGLPAGARFTGPQLAWLERAGIDPATVETLTVLSPVGMRELWWPGGTPGPVYAIECPNIRRRGAGQVLVVSPAGERNRVVWG